MEAFNMLSLNKPNSLKLNLLTQFINKAHLAVWLWDMRNEDFIFISNKLMDQFKLITNKKITKREISRLIEKTSSHDLENLQETLKEKTEYFHSYFINLPNGDSIWFDTTIVAIEDEQNDLEFAAGFVSERREIGNPENNKIPNHQDEYTNLPNLIYGRKFLQKTIDENKQKKRKFTLYKIIIPTYDNILMTLGHEVAEQILLETSRRLNQFMFDKGFLFHSYTDGWYAIIQRDRHVQRTAEQLIEVVQESMTINQQKVHLTANVGIGIYPNDGENVVDLIKHTTIATINAVELGPGRIGFYIQDNSIDLLRQSQLTADLFQSIQNAEFYLEYQPQINVKTLEVTGAEALLRWKHPIWGNVPPNEFIPLAQDLGLGEGITAFVIGKAIKQLRIWEDAGVPNPKVAINLAPETFLMPHLYDYIKKTLNKHKVDPEQLTIEITEETKLKYDEILVNTIEKIQSLGIRLALDDMGDGFASIYDIVHYNFNTVKIDRQAIDDLENNKKQQIIIKSLLDLCSRLQVKTIVEGVERRKQFDMIREMGADEIQGYYFSPSISSEEMLSWFQMKYATPSNDNEARRLDRRKYFLVTLANSLLAEMKILSIQEKEITLERNTKILIQNIGPGGIKFASYLILPTNKDIVYGFDLQLLGEHYNLAGRIVWSREIKKSIFEYGVEFSISETKREKLTSSLFQLSALLREKPTYVDSNMTEDDPVLYLRKLVFNERNNK